MTTHLADVDGTEGVAEEMFCRFLPIRINKQDVMALVDSGNLWRNVMSLSLLRQLGYDIDDLRPLGTRSVATAKAGAQLEVLGEFRERITLHLGDSGTQIKTRPVVVDGLTMPFNLAGPFLKKHGIDQLHSRNAIRYQGKQFPLCRRSEEKSRSPVGQEVYVLEKTVVPARGACVTKLGVRNSERQIPPAGEGLLRGDLAFEARTQLRTGRPIKVTREVTGHLPGVLKNNTNAAITVAVGENYGSFQPAMKKVQKKPVDVTKPKEAGISPHPGQQEEMADSQQTAGNTRQWPVGQKRAWLRAEFRLDDSPCLTTEGQRLEATDLLLKYWNVFSHGGEFGATSLVKHRIYTVPNTPPIRVKNRSLNPSLEPSLRAQLDVWLKQGVIEPTHSPWSFPLVAVTKRNGKTRWCCDYRKLNQTTTHDAFPMPNIEDNLARLAHSTVFSGIDGCGAYHVIEVREKDRPKTAFSTPWGSFQFRRLPFGLQNAPSTYCRLVQMVLADIPTSVAIPYLDDTCIHSVDLKSHFAGLRRVLQAQQDAGLKLQPSKCFLFRSRIEYLGHVISEEGLAPMPKYLEVVKNWPLPTTRSEARTFLGKTGYYRRFIEHYSHIAAPWSDITGKGTPEEEKTPLEVTPAMEQSFELLKEKLLTAPILAYPQFDSPEEFILDTDWSQEAACIGAVLSQKQNGKERVIAYAAKKLSKSEANYAPTKGELCAVIHFVRFFKYYLQYRHFILRTDHQALKYIKTMEEPTGMVGRWLDTLANYDFTVIHRKGTAHGNADALSRINHATSYATWQEDDVPLALLAIQADHPWSRAEIRDLQLQDEDLSVIRRMVQQGRQVAHLDRHAMSQTGQTYAGLRDSLEMDKDDLLVRVDNTLPLIGTRRQICLPKAIWEEAVRRVHVAGGHMAVEATVKRMQRNMYFPNMKREVTECLATCRDCQMKDRKKADQRHTLVSVQDGYPFQKLAIDFVGPLTPSAKGNCYILTAKCCFTRWVEAYPVKKATAEQVVRILQRECFSRFGLPEEIHSDQGSQFTSNLMAAVAQALGVRLTTTPAYNPKSNSVERSHRDLGAAIRALTLREPRQWEEVLPTVLFALRTSVCRTTGLAPYQLLFGRDASQPLDHIFGPPPSNLPSCTTDSQLYARQLRQRMDAAQAYARQHIGKAVRRQRRQYHQDKKSFVNGALVWLLTPRSQPGISRKLTTVWSGPWTITRRVNELMYLIAPDPRWVQTKSPCTVSIDRLKLYHRSERPTMPTWNLTVTTTWISSKMSSLRRTTHRQTRDHFRHWRIIICRRLHHVDSDGDDNDDPHNPPPPGGGAQGTPPAAPPVVIDLADDEEEPPGEQEPPG